MLLTYLHLATVAPALLIGGIVLARRKGGPTHRAWGRAWAILMVVSSLLSFGIRHQGRLSWLHGLSALTIFAVFRAVRAIRRRDLRTHKRSMVMAYAGSCIALVYAMRPDRLLGEWVRKLF